MNFLLNFSNSLSSSQSLAFALFFLPVSQSVFSVLHPLCRDPSLFILLVPSGGPVFRAALRLLVPSPRLTTGSIIHEISCLVFVSP